MVAKNLHEIPPEILSFSIPFLNLKRLSECIIVERHWITAINRPQITVAQYDPENSSATLDILSALDSIDNKMEVSN